MSDTRDERDLDVDVPETTAPEATFWPPAEGEGGEVLVDDEGNPVLDDDGNPTPAMRDADGNLVARDAGGKPRKA